MFMIHITDDSYTDGRKTLWLQNFDNALHILILRFRIVKLSVGILHTLPMTRTQRREMNGMADKLSEILAAYRPKKSKPVSTPAIQYVPGGAESSSGETTLCT